MGQDSLENQLKGLKEDLLRMGTLLQEQIFNADLALFNKDMNLAREVIVKEDIIDQMHSDIEQKVLLMIALKQPMARDLRFIATALRFIIDMERMADHAEGIAKIAIRLYDEPYMKPLIDIPKMARMAQEMVHIAMQSFIASDVALAMSLVPLEKEVDALYMRVYDELVEYMKRDPSTVAQATLLLLVAGHLERVADLATNLGEMVIYLIEGRRIDLNVIARS